MPRLVTQSEWNQWYNQVYGYFFRRLNNRFDVDELASDTVTEFFLKDFVPENPKAFIFGIARNKLYQYFDKKAKNRVAELDGQAETLTCEAADSYSSFYLAKIAELRKCIQQQLSKQDQEIVELCVVCEFSSERVARELNLSPPNVRQRLSRALRKLRRECRDIWLRTA